MRNKWSLPILFVILLGLAIYLILAVRSAAHEPWPEVGIARCCFAEGDDGGDSDAEKNGSRARAA